MKSAYISSFALAGLLTLIAPEGQAASVRCGTHIISDRGIPGPTMYEVLKKCGEPRDRTGNTWIYKLKGRYWSMRFDGNGTLMRVSREE
jgi:hypothetical protein